MLQTDRTGDDNTPPAERPRGKKKNLTDFDGNTFINNGHFTCDHLSAISGSALGYLMNFSERKLIRRFASSIADLSASS